MIKINYSRRSVCMGDDINNGNYVLFFKENASLKDFDNWFVNSPICRKSNNIALLLSLFLTKSLKESMLVRSSFKSLK